MINAFFMTKHLMVIDLRAHSVHFFHIHIYYTADSLFGFDFFTSGTEITMSWRNRHSNQILQQAAGYVVNAKDKQNYQ